MTFVVGSAGQFGYVRVSDGLCNWWSHVPREHEPTKAELRAMTTESIGKELSRRHAGWHEPVLTLIKKTKSITTTAVYALPTLRAWYRGRVALIGDAAHGTSPSAGQGASIALEAAMFLAKMLRTSPSPQEAYSRYERSRKARAEKVAMMARQRDAHEKKQLSPVQTWIRDKLFAAVLPSSENGACDGSTSTGSVGTTSDLHDVSPVRDARCEYEDQHVDGDVRVFLPPKVHEDGPHHRENEADCGERR